MKRLFNTLALVILTGIQLYSQEAEWRHAAGTEGVYIAGIDVFRSNPDTLYVIGSQEVDNSFQPSILLRSTERGENWDSIAPYGTDIGVIKVDPTDSKILYVSRIGISWESNDIMISSDGVTTWQRLFRGRIFPSPVIEIDPVNPKIVYASE